MKIEKEIKRKQDFIKRSRENLQKLKPSRQHDFNDGWYEALKWVLEE